MSFSANNSKIIVSSELDFYKNEANTLREILSKKDGNERMQLLKQMKKIIKSRKL